MTCSDINFKQLYWQLKKWFDRSSPFEDFDSWRLNLYEKQNRGTLANLPLKIWWPKYSAPQGDFRFELCLGALLIQQISWIGVESSLKNLLDYLKRKNKSFDPPGVLSIPLKKLKELLQPSRFAQSKGKNILLLCEHIQKKGGVDNFFRNKNRRGFGQELKNLSGFGDETRDCVLLYGANIPAFMADSYARKLLQLLSGREWNYSSCQKAFEDGISRDFTKRDLRKILRDYTPKERFHGLSNSPKASDEELGQVLLYQQFHAGIDELGISRRWEEFVGEYL